MVCEKPLTPNEKRYGKLLSQFLLSSNRTLTKDEMLQYLGWGKDKDRQLRNLLSIIAQHAPLISVSSDKGYRIAKTEADLEDVEHAWAELSKRMEELEKRIAPLKKFRDKIKFGK